MLPSELVDRFAISLGVAGDDHRRVEAGILFELRYNLTAGHSFLPKEKLAAATAQLLSVDVDTVNAGLDRLAEGERVVLETLAGIPVIYLPELAEAEAYTAMRLLQFAADHKKTPPDLDKMVRIAASESGLTYSAQQEQAIRMQPPVACWWLPAAPAPARPASSTASCPSLTRWGWSASWRPLRAVRPSGSRRSRAGRPAPSTGCWRRASTPTPA